MKAEAKGRPLTLGGCAAQLRAGGYTVVSALAPFGQTLGQHPAMFVEDLPGWSMSEHPPAIVCGDVLALILQSGADPEMADRIRAVLDKAELTAGPCRVGSDGTCVWPLHFTGYDFWSAEVLGVTFARRMRAGPFGQQYPVLLPLDGAWSQSLLTVALSELPSISAEQIGAVLELIRELPAKIAQERAPPIPPSRLGFIGR